MLLLAGAALLRASTCGPLAWPPACEDFHQTPAIFSGERTGGAGRFYLVRVDQERQNGVIPGHPPNCSVDLAKLLLLNGLTSIRRRF